MKKRIILIFMCIFLLMLMSCSNANVKVNDDFFEIDEATKAGKIYMEELSLDDKNNIDSYNLEKVTEAANYVILDYKVIRKSSDNINIDLDLFNIKVEKKDGNYEVSKIKSKNSMQVYIDKNNLRIRDEDTGMSELLLRERDIPKEVYPKDNEIMINKVNVVSGKYSLLALDTKGEKVGIINKNDNQNFIMLAQINNAKETIGESSDGGNENITSNLDYNNLEEILEKPVASRITPYDLIQSNIDKLIFTADGDFLLVHTNDNNIGRLLIYKNPSGEKIDMNLDEIFPNNQYSLDIKKIDETGTYIDIKAITEVKEKEGLYKLEFNSGKIFKQD